MIYERRSVRRYTNESISDNDIKEIIKAGFSAPHGASEQSIVFAVVTNRTKLKAYAEKGRAMTLGLFQKMNAENPSDRLTRFMKSLSNPNFDILYGAPALIVLFTPPKHPLPEVDASLAAENMMLAAKSLGLGSCWIQFAKALGKDPEFMKDVGVPIEYQLVAPLIFGHPKSEEKKAPSGEEPTILGWVK